LFFPAAAQAKGEKPAAPPREAFAPVADRILQPAMWQKRLPGLVVGVVKEGRIVITKGYGVKSFESGGVPDENTVFFIGSLSKAITAVGAMLLVEHGKLDLNAPASKYLKGLPKNWQGITVAQFMAHQSGIPQLNRKLPTFDQMLRSADGVPLSFPPGTRQEYNNFNFAVVGKVIEAVSGMSYLDYMKRTVFGPLRMDRTGTDLRGRNVATAYRPAGRELRPIEHRIRGGAYGIPSGHLQSTLADLLKLHEAFRTGKLLKPATYEQMIARINPTLSGTPGWFEQKAGRYSVVTKNGATQGFHSVMSFVPGKGDAVVLLWTSQKPKGNGLGMVKNRLLERICNVAVRGEVEPTAGRDDE
jgi:CubicO group peptidase (beta-lactamase class C family)